MQHFQRNMGILATSLLPLLASAQAYSYPNGSIVADFTVLDADGIAYNLYDLNAQGKYVFLDFFTLSCVPCQETGPFWAEFHETYGCNAGQVFCLSLDMGSNPATALEAYADAYSGTWAHPPMVTGALPLSDVFGIGSAPNYCLIGPDHVMINNYIWTVGSMADFVAALPAGSGIVPMACGTGILERSPAVPVVHPNPTTGRLWIDAATATSVLVRDACGRGLDRLPIHCGALDLPAKGPGLYVLDFFDAQGLDLGRTCVLKW